MPKKSFLIDINGVLYVGGQPISGAIETIRFLRENKNRFLFVTNATRSSRNKIQQKLSSMGFDIGPEEIFSAPVATIDYIRRTGKNRVFLLSTGNADKDFESAGIIVTDRNPDFVVVGDAGENFNFHNMNKAFNLLLSGAELIAMEKDLHWMTDEGRILSAGPFVAALEYATGKTAKVIGKPSKDFYRLALKKINAKAKDTIMIGDDLQTDIEGAQKSGMKAYLALTGKTGRAELKKTKIKPDKIIKSIAGIQDIL